MHRISEYTNAQLAGLTEDEVEKLIDVECLHLGVPLPGPAPTPPEPGVADPRPDLTAYEVAGVLVTDKSDAEELASWLNDIERVKTTYIEGFYRYDGPQGIVPDEDEVVPVRRAYWSSKWYEAHASVLQARKAAQDEYQSAKDEWDALATGRRDVADTVRTHITSARHAEARDQAIRRDYAEYLALADDNHTMARTFFDAAGRYTKADIARVLDTPQDKEDE